MTLDGILVAMQYSASQPSAGWYPDPAGSGDERYWDGATWSSVTRPNSRPAAQSSYGNAPGRSQDRSRYAGWWSRCAATLLDALVLAIPSQIVAEAFAPGSLERLQAWMYEMIRASQYYSSETLDALTAEMQPAMLVITVLGVIYRAVLVAVCGGTVGKMIMRIRVTRASDPSQQTPGLWRSIIRAVGVEVIGLIGRAVVFLPVVSYLMPLFTQKKQTVHDMMAGTIVVKK